ncbi:hypothetical protein VNO78_18060 [Psophocarpus tetragonolobus]|uniref:Uncharacterized protein n=1 Tax=Psophocarpus tetragonolobus TaxID=3891 RepID=A0AAN9XLQ1_PSOTE
MNWFYVTKWKRLAKIYRTLNASDVMIIVHGAAMTHFLFLRPGSVFIQVVPLGTTWAAETHYGEPARKLGGYWNGGKGIIMEIGDIKTVQSMELEMKADKIGLQRSEKELYKFPLAGQSTLSPVVDQRDGGHARLTTTRKKRPERLRPRVPASAWLPAASLTENSERRNGEVRMHHHCPGVGGGQWLKKKKRANQSLKPFLLES